MGLWLWINISLVFTGLRYADGRGSNWERCVLEGVFYTIRVLESGSTSTEWSLLYIPDNIDDIFYIYQSCLCGRRELRILVNYKDYNRPGIALPDYSLHLIGETITRTPELNVLWARQYIRGRRR